MGMGEPRHRLHGLQPSQGRPRAGGGGAATAPSAVRAALRRVRDLPPLSAPRCLRGVARLPLHRRASGAERRMSLEAAVRAAIPADVAELLRRLRAAGFASYVVGGALRDVIAGRAPVDWDLATDATPDALRSHFPDARYENRFGTVGIPTAAGLVREVTTFRVDGSSSDARRPDAVRFIGDLRGDLDRRDFTINAIAFGLGSDDAEGNDPVATGTLVDPHGGAADLAAGLLRAVGDPGVRFREDALRMLRAARFAARFNLKIDPLTAAAIRREIGSAHVCTPALHDALPISWEIRRNGFAKMRCACSAPCASRRASASPSSPRPRR